jgi:hypothetical protein
MANLKGKCDEENNIIVSLEKKVETRKQKKQKMEDQQEQSTGQTTPLVTHWSKIN